MAASPAVSVSLCEAAGTEPPSCWFSPARPTHTAHRCASCTPPQRSAWRSQANSFPSGTAPSSRPARRQAPKYTAHRRKRCLCVRCLPSTLLVFTSGVRSEAGGRGLWASHAVCAVESSGLAHVERVGQVLLFECESEPGLQGCNFLRLAPAFPPAPLREVQRMMMKDDPTHPKPQAFTHHRWLLPAYPAAHKTATQRLPAAPGAFLCSQVSWPSSR